MSTDPFGRVMVVLNRYGMPTLQGAGVSLKIALVGTLVGCIISSVVGIIQTMPSERGDSSVKRTVSRVVKLILNVYMEFFRGTPMMAQVMSIYYGLLPMLGISMLTQGAAYLILSISTGAYMAETVRGRILSINPSQTEGAKAIGITYVQTAFYVTLPQALRNIMSQIGNNLTIDAKDSYALFVIGVTELLHKTEAAAGTLCMSFEAYTTTMTIYFIMTFICPRILRQQENRMNGVDSCDPATADILTHTNDMCRFPGERDKKKGDAR